MTISELLDAAKRRQGSLGAVAEYFGFAQTRLSEWRSGKRKPDAGQILVLAELAGLPPLETLAEIEQELDAKHASVWARALGNLRAAGVAASVTLALATSVMTSNDAKAATSVDLSGSKSTLSARYTGNPRNAERLAGVFLLRHENRG
ncbi:hypothetical protein BTM_2746 [Burkholderia thailandensis 34]|uniref:transcriptional regulator n=1 Tax=Burkholderia thailandensis TaxID=57975 RepID=UPI0005DA4A36|nr:transcriptional regulator [Burkholderia thailandensis]AJY27387.1 hypothetical protein BTM_2746 [Burkholderia thailandensis 34]KXF61567.1 hypothetical protein AQ476_09825 [Burkholderia thailandensis]